MTGYIFVVDFHVSRVKKALRAAAFMGVSPLRGSESFLLLFICILMRKAFYCLLSAFFVSGSVANVALGHSIHYVLACVCLVASFVFARLAYLSEECQQGVAHPIRVEGALP